jgi:hypothetical protein
MSLYGNYVSSATLIPRASSDMSKWLKITGGILLTVVCLFAWGVIAMDYSDHVAAGTYTFERNGESSTLSLNPDHTFRQKRRLGSVEQQSEGTWRPVGMGGFSFSKEFLVVTGDEPEPDGTTFCDMHKLLGILPSLRLRQYYVLWYGKTSSGGSPVGTYKGDEPNVVATLTLNEDHSFAQTLIHDNVPKHVSGTWNEDSKGTIWFSKEFMKTSGESLSGDELASSTDPQGSNLQIEISLSQHIAEPVFHRHLVFKGSRKTEFSETSVERPLPSRKG